MEMNKNSFILLTGAAGFIGSYMLGYLNRKGYNKIIIVDDFNDEDKWFNFDSKKFITKVEREELFDWLRVADPKIDFVFHLGARDYYNDSYKTLLSSLLGADLYGGL